MESNAVQENAKVLSEVNGAENSSKDETKQNSQPNTKAQKIENWIETPYKKKLSKSCEKLPPLIRKNSCDGLFLSHSMPSKTLVGHMCSAEKKSSKTYQTINIMKIKERNLKPDVTKDAGICTDLNVPEMVNNAGLPSLSSHTPPFDSSRVGFFPRGSSEFARESFGQKPGFFHLSIEKPDTRRVTDHTHSSPKAEILTHEGGNTDVPRSYQAGSNVSRSLNSQCGHLRSASTLAFSYHSSSGSSSSSSLSQSSPRESYLSQSLNSGQHREKQLRKNTQNLKNCLSQEDIPKICPSQARWEQHRLSQLGSQTSQLSCDENIKGHIGSENVKGSCRASLKNLPSAPLEVCQELTHSKKKDLNIHLGKETSSEILVSDKETGSTENTKISENEKQESVTKKELCDKLVLIKPENAEILSRTVRHVKSQNRTNSPYSAKVINVRQKMYRSMTVAKIETMSSSNEFQHQILLGLQKRSNHQKSVSGLRPKDVGVCISSATIHKRAERNAAKPVQNKECIFETKTTVESKKPQTSELSKQHKVRKARNGENKPLLDILAQRTQTASVTKLDSCVKIEDMFENLREHKKEPHPNYKAVNRQKSAVEKKRIQQQNVSCPKLIGGKLLQLQNENQGSKRANRHSNQKRSNENESRGHKTLRKRQSKSKRKNTQQLPARSESEEDLPAKLSSNMALISGPDWHIVTDCIDVSNVKVVEHSHVYQDYNSYMKGRQSDKDDNPDDSRQNDNNKTIENFHSEFLNNLINEKEDKNLSHLTDYDVNSQNGNSQNGNSSNQKLPSVDESPETLKTDEILKNTDWNDSRNCSFDGKNTKPSNLQSEVLSFQNNEHEYADFNKSFSESEIVPENLNSSIADADSKYETDFECLSPDGSDCPEELEDLSNRILDSSSPDSLQLKTAEVTQENLDSIVEELLNYSTSPICLEKRLSNVSLSETDSILFRSLKHQKESPFYAPYKVEDTAAPEEGNTDDFRENLEMSVTKKSFNKSLKGQVPQKCSRVDGNLSDKETGSLSQLEELNNKHGILGRRDSTSTTSSFVSIEEDFSWKKGDLLGSGSYGRVWRGLTSDGEQIAVKQIMLDVTDRQNAERKYQKVQEEVEILKTLQHKNIVSFLGMRREGEEVSIFMQYVTGGSIAQLLARFGPLDEPVFCSYTQQILEGVKYLHDKNVIHRDIKGGNVMLMPNSTIKLVDFGCAKRLCYSLNKNSLCNPTSLQGTPYWMAPEVIQETGHGKKSDIWSIGCTVFEMATKNPPWSNMNPYAAILAICSSKPVPILPLEFSQKARDFVRVCLIRDPLKRPTASELLQDKFITTPHHGRRRKSVTCFN